MSYEFLHDAVVADLAFQAQGSTLEEVFQGAACAVMSAMIENAKAILPREQRQFRLQNDQLDLLLFDYLNEFLYHKDASQLLLRPGAVRIEQREAIYYLEAQAVGERLDPSRHHQGVDVKAITLHKFKLEKTAQGWVAFVVMDI